jgi:hypothetical protein
MTHTKDEALKLALDGQRHLVEILAENWRVWPAQKAVEQTCLGDVYCSTKGRDLMFGNHEIAVDQDSAVVTKEMWSTMRQTLAAQPAPVQELVYQIRYYENSTAWHDVGFSAYTERPEKDRRILYTTPPAQPAPVPLTDEQIEDLRSEANRGFCIEREDYFKAFRDAEAAHGITEKGQP